MEAGSAGTIWVGAPEDKR